MIDNRPAQSFILYYALANVTILRKDKTKGINMQRSDSFVVGALLSFSGGLQDSYTFNIRDRVFANAQTGNVVLMSQNFMMGNWSDGLGHLFAIIAFVTGVFLSDYIEGKFKYNNKIHWRQIVLIIEFLILFVVGFIPLGCNIVANASVSFACAMQVHSFRRLRTNSYASTMCIGNLKNGTSYMARYIRNRSIKDLIFSVQYYSIIVIFAVGAGIGGLLSIHCGIRTIWVSCVVIIVVTLILNKEKAFGFSYLRKFPKLYKMLKNRDIKETK